MADLHTSEPNRKAPARAVVQGQTSLTALGWSVWTFALLLAALVTVVDRTRFLGAALILTLSAISVLLLVRRQARRVQWIFLLDGDRLSIERVPPRDVGSIKSLDVRGGVRLDVIADKPALRLDAAIALQTMECRAIWSPGLRPAQAIAQLISFLRDNDVPVQLPPDAPVGWRPPDYPLMP